MAKGTTEPFGGSDAQFFRQNRGRALSTTRQVRAGYDDPPSIQGVYSNPPERRRITATCQPFDAGKGRDCSASADPWAERTPQIRAPGELT